MLRIGRRYRIPRPPLEAFIKDRRASAIVDDDPELRESQTQRLIAKLSGLDERKQSFIEQVVDALERLR